MKARLLAMLLASAMTAAQGQGFDLTDTAGAHHALGDYKGKWVVLNVWASWCAPCIQEMPELDAMSKRHSNVVVLGLAADGEDIGKLKRFASALKVSYPIIAGDADTVRDYKLRAFPTTLVFNPEGQQVARREGRITHHDIDSLTGQACP